MVMDTRGATLYVLLASAGCRPAPSAPPAPTPAASASTAEAPPRAGDPRWEPLAKGEARIVEPDPAPSVTVSGRAMVVRADPRDANVVYIGTVGGVWKTRDFDSPSPTWRLLTGAIDSAPVSALDLDPKNPDRVFIGTGDPFSVPRLGAGLVLRSEDGGETWGEPVALGGRAGAVRALAVDPSDPGEILVAAENGLHPSTDGGAHFALVPLPHAGGARVEDAMWSIAYLGVEKGASRWAVSGVHPCEDHRRRALVEALRRGAADRPRDGLLRGEAGRPLAHRDVGPRDLGAPAVTRPEPA